MNEQDNGGAAFPQSVQHLNGHIAPFAEGMDMRDYFAAKAMQAMVTHDLACFKGKPVLQLAYEIADQMLKARKG